MSRKPASIAFLIIASAAVAGCEPSATKLCKLDKFFCSAESTWRSKAAGLSQKELYDLDDKYASIMRAGNTAFEDGITNGGSAALDNVLGYIEQKGEFNTYVLLNIVSKIRTDSDKSVCQEPHLGKIYAVVGDPKLTDRARKTPTERVDIFKQYCSS